jgi:hypothetical protein
MHTLDFPFAYDACDIPAEMTIAEFRASRAEVQTGRTGALTALRRPLQLFMRHRLGGNSKES